MNQIIDVGFDNPLRDGLGQGAKPDTCRQETQDDVIRKFRKAS
jgi:hypothetical protein